LVSVPPVRGLVNWISLRCVHLTFPGAARLQPEETSDRRWIGSIAATLAVGLMVVTLAYLV